MDTESIDFRSDLEASLRGFQDRICADVETQDGSAGFVEDLWKRPGGGGGRTRILQHGQLIEKVVLTFRRIWSDYRHTT